MNFVDSYTFLLDHPIFQNAFKACLEFEVVKVDPQTCQIEDDELRNTKPQVRLKCGPLLSNIFGDYPLHDGDLDCAAGSFEAAIVTLAKLVREKYGTREKPRPFDTDSLPVNVRL